MAKATKKYFMDNKSYQLGYGIIQPTLYVQLKKQKYKFDKDEVKEFEKIRVSINILYFKNYITESQYQKMIIKLHKKVCAHIAKENNLKLKK